MACQGQVRTSKGLLCRTVFVRAFWPGGQQQDNRPYSTFLIPLRDCLRPVLHGRSAEMHISAAGPWQAFATACGLRCGKDIGLFPILAAETIGPFPNPPVSEGRGHGSPGTSWTWMAPLGDAAQPRDLFGLRQGEGGRRLLRAPAETPLGILVAHFGPSWQVPHALEPI